MTDREDLLAELKRVSQVVVVEPGDVLLISYKRDLSRDEAERIRERWQHWLPLGTQFIIAVADELGVVRQQAAGGGM